MNLTICLDMYGCPNRCKHCWIGHMPNRQLRDEDAVFVINKFEPYFEDITFYSWLREPDYCEDYKSRWLRDNELSGKHKPKRFELASFYRLNRDAGYVSFLKEVGVRKVQLTFFGMEAMTDKYVGRRGAFGELLKATDILVSNGITPRWQAFINEENKDDLWNLLSVIDELKLKDSCPDFKFFLHEGSCDGENAKLYDLRIQKGHVPEKLLPYYSDYHNLKTEQEFVCEYRAKSSEYFVPSNSGGDAVIYISNTFDVYFNFTNMTAEWKIGNLMEDDMGEISRRIIEEDIPALRMAREISLSELALRYGSEQSQRLFGEDDFKMYLLNRHLG